MKEFISVIILVIGVFWGGYCVFFYMPGHSIEEKDVVIKIVNSKDKSAISQNQKQILELINILKQIKIQQAKRYPEIQEYKRENYLTVSKLNGFYSSLFTVIAIFIALAGLFAWKKISNSLKQIDSLSDKVTEKLNQLEGINKKVALLYKKKEFAKWAKDKFDNNKNREITSSDLNLSDDDEKKFNEIKKHLLGESTDNSWLEIILAKKFFGNKKFENNKFEKAFTIYDFIQKRGLFDNNSKIEAVLYHMLGQLYFEYYLRIKNNRSAEISKDTEIDKIDNKEKTTINDHLEICIKYYKKSFEIREEQKIPNDETLGNLAVVLIEYARLNSDKKAAKDAIDYLNKIEVQKATYNTFYDLARATFLNDTNKTDDVKKYLKKAAENVDFIKEKKKFYDFLDNEDVLIGIHDFEQTRKELKKAINRKQWLK